LLATFDLLHCLYFFLPLGVLRSWGVDIEKVKKTPEVEKKE